MNSPSPQRKSAWNTYDPRTLAFFGILSAILFIAVVITWIPSPDVPGVSTGQQNTGLVPGGLGLLSFILTGRQLYLRSQAKNTR